MIFSIQRASGTYKYKDPKPCPDAVEILPPNEDDNEEGLYIIEFADLSELWVFIQTQGKIVLYPDGKHRYNVFTKPYEEALAKMPNALLMIYDDYLE